MIVLTSCDGNNNIIQIILGASMDVQISLMGAITVDLDTIINKFKEDLPIKLVITKTSDEGQLMQIISRGGGGIPFNHRNSRNSEDDEDDEDDENDQGDNFLDLLKKNIQSKYGNELEDVKNNDPRGHYAKLIVCPKCNNHGVFLKPETPALCADCLKIENGLGNIKSE